VSETLGAVMTVWLLWEVASVVVSKPARDGEPIRPPLSVFEYLYYNPGRWRGGES